MDITRSAVSDSALYEAKCGREAFMDSRGFHLGLRFKLLILVVSVSLASVLASTLLLFSFQRRQLIENAQSSTTVLSNTIEASLRHAMHAADWRMVNEAVQALVAEETIDTVRIVDTQGVVEVSSVPGEVGIRFDQSVARCQFCHATSNPTYNKTNIFDSNSGHEVLFNVNLIENQPECQACHGPEARILGLLMLEAPMTNLTAGLTADFRRTILLALAAFALLIGLLVPALNRYVIHPVEDLSTGMAEISTGNLDYRVQAASQDELGKLAESFDDMRRQLKASRLEMERRNQELSVLNEVALTVSQSLDLQQVLDVALVTVAGRLEMEAGFIFLLDVDTGCFTLRASTGASQGICQEIERRRKHPSNDISGQVARTNKPYFVADMNSDGRFSGLWDDMYNRTFVNVPLISKGKVVGTMGLVSYAGRPMAAQAVAVIEAVGNEIGIAIENARLYRQLRYLAALEERDRLAREMHDRLAQALGYLNVKASITGDLLSGGRTEQVQESLLELKKVAKIVYTDVREAIFNLRTAVSSQMGLLLTLQDYLAEYRAHYGLDAHLVIGNEDLPEFSNEVAGQLLRIIQEALTNVRKHASASSVRIRYRQDCDKACISIEDNGRGFLPAEVAEGGRQRYGLQIMRERAESVGGSLELDSQPGQGTRIIVRVPLHFRE